MILQEGMRGKNGGLSLREGWSIWDNSNHLGRVCLKEYSHPRERRNDQRRILMFQIIQYLRSLNELLKSTLAKGNPFLESLGGMMKYQVALR